VTKAQGVARALRFSILLSVGVVAACGHEKRVERTTRQWAPQRAPQIADGAVPERPTTESPERATEGEDCKAKIERVLAEPALPGTPTLHARRIGLFIAVKGEPTLFVRPPEWDETDDVTVKGYRRWLRASSRPGGVIAELLYRLADRPKVIRATLLRDGYLYADNLPLANALVRDLRADLLFDEPLIWIQRGERMLSAVKDSKTRQYVYGDGEDAGRPVSLVLFDRVGVGPVPEPVHRDVRALRYRLGFDAMRVRRLTADGVVADLRYGEYSVPTLLESSGAHLDRMCEVLPPGSERQMERVRDLGIQRARAFRSVQHAIVAQIDDALPFDEPKHEIGQEDGKLRPAFRRAYAAGKLTYEHHGDEYPVFGARGQPLPPEVCVDFLLDSIERAGGTWWRPREEPRERVVGLVDFDILGEDARRRAPEFVEYAREHPEWFEVLEIHESHRIPMGDEEAFTRYLVGHAADFIAGDMILIGGYVPWDRRQYTHYHSFFVYESDPLTGMPLLVAGNPGPPSLRAWRIEMRRTPRRTLRYRIRPRPEWLSRVVIPEQGELAPPSLAR
jgi:hypothetical protein